MKHTCRNTETQRGMHTGIHSVHRDRQKPDTAKTHTLREQAGKKRKDTRAQEAWVFLYKIFEKITDVQGERICMPYGLQSSRLSSF